MTQPGSSSCPAARAQHGRVWGHVCPKPSARPLTSARRDAVISVSTKHPTKQPPGVTTASQRSTPLSTTQVPSPDFLDVENAIAADPLIDLAMTIRYDLDKSPHKRAGLLDGYGPAADR